MRHLAAVVSLLGLASCAAAGAAEDFRWTVECPKSVERGSEFRFTVRAVRAGRDEGAEVDFRYEIRWAAGSGSPLRHHGRTGTPVKAHVRVVPGPATLQILCDDREGRPVQVAEAGFEVQ